MLTKHLLKDMVTNRLGNRYVASLAHVEEVAPRPIQTKNLLKKFMPNTLGMRPMVGPIL
jgi:hypothetical protein